MNPNDFDTGIDGAFGAPSYDVEDTIVTGAASTFNTQLHALVYLHTQLGAQMGSLQDDYVTFPQAVWQVTSAELQPFKALDDRYGENAVWGIFNFADQVGGAIAFLDTQAAATVTGLGEDEVQSEEGLGYVETFLAHFAYHFQTTWADIAGFDVEVIPAPTAPTMAELQEMFPGLNGKTPMVTTAFRVAQVGASGTARIVLAIPQAYLHPLEPSLVAIGQMATTSTDTSYFHQRLSYLDDVSIPVSVLLGRTEMSVSELQGLEEGDVIELDTTVGLPLGVTVGSHRLLGKPGTSQDGRRLAVQIVSASE